MLSWFTTLQLFSPLSFSFLSAVSCLATCKAETVVYVAPTPALCMDVHVVDRYVVLVCLFCAIGYSHGKNDQVTNVVQIEDHVYSTLKRPGKDSPIVQRVLELNVQLQNVEGMLHLFSHVGVFIRVAQHGLKLYPVMQAELTAFAISVAELNDEAGLMVSKFAAVSEIVLSQFEFALWYLYNNKRIQAMEELKLIRDSAVQMIEQASNIRDKVVRKRNEVVDYVNKTANESLQLLDKKRKLEEQKRDFEGKVKEAESSMKEAEEKEKLYYSLYKETCEQEYDAYGDVLIASLINGIFKIGAILFTGNVSGLAGKEPVDTSPAKEYMGSLSQRAMSYFEKVEEYVEKKQRAVESYVKNNFYSAAKVTDIQINEETYDALIGAQESLQLIALIMNDIVFFWSSMHEYLKFLLIEDPRNLNSFISLITTMDVERLWEDEPFKTQVVTFYSHWVALINVCKQSMKEFAKTRENMRAAMLMDEQSVLAKYENLRKNPRLIEQQKN